MELGNDTFLKRQYDELGESIRCKRRTTEEAIEEKSKQTQEKLNALRKELDDFQTQQHQACETFCAGQKQILHTLASQWRTMEIEKQMRAAHRNLVVSKALQLLIYLPLGIDIATAPEPRMPIAPAPEDLTRWVHHLKNAIALEPASEDIQSKTLELFERSFSIGIDALPHRDAIHQGFLTLFNEAPIPFKCALQECMKANSASIEQNLDTLPNLRALSIAILSFHVTRI